MKASSLLLLAALGLAGCSASSASPDDEEGSAGAGGSAGSAGTGAGGGLNLGGAPGSDGGSPLPEGAVYGHSAGTLYKLEPYSGVVTKLGDFDCLGSMQMWDLALDKDGRMVGTLGNDGGALATIDPKTAHCTITRTGSYPNSLTFLPIGTLDATREAMVGFTGANYVRIDPDTGVVTTVGSLNPNDTGRQWTSSGDVVSVIGGKTYLTAKTLLGGEATDTLLEIDPITGKALKILGRVGGTGYADLYGLAFWAGTAYGFSASGQLVELDLQTGAGRALPLTGLGRLSFYGAGTTTAAPLVPPQ